MGEARSAGSKTAGPRRKEGGCKFGVRCSAARRTRMQMRRWRRKAGASGSLEAHCRHEGLRVSCRRAPANAAAVSECAAHRRLPRVTVVSLARVLGAPRGPLLGLVPASPAPCDCPQASTTLPRAITRLCCPEALAILRKLRRRTLRRRPLFAQKSGTTARASSLDSPRLAPPSPLLTPLSPLLRRPPCRRSPPTTSASA